MGKYDKLIDKILRGSSDANIPFDDLRGLLIRLGFDERIRGSHHVYRKEGIEEKLNLQQDDSKAKPYQVRQVRFIIIKYHLADEI
ncbi:MAG: type II toxin-antitoxin system HicA family toxin [Methylobacter sp.]|uniref:type II toxin-antitoxin system HicA family toxin n=1 Tax=Methylobacter sp. TaxID=2051955 RepID=UPI002FDE2C6B|nr:type II toxin-antitoxin system HicA family toxin [Methylobacter sp.]